MADIHKQDDHALHWAAGRGNIELVRILLDRAADIHAKDGHALRYSAENGHLELVRILLGRAPTSTQKAMKACAGQQNTGILKWCGYFLIVAQMRLLKTAWHCVTAWPMVTPM